MNADEEKSSAKSNKKGNRFFVGNVKRDPVAESARALLGLDDVDSEDGK